MTSSYEYDFCYEYDILLKSIFPSKNKIKVCKCTLFLKLIMWKLYQKTKICNIQNGKKEFVSNVEIKTFLKSKIKSEIKTNW